MMTTTKENMKTTIFRGNGAFLSESKAITTLNGQNISRSVTEK